eukprot:TRINITY_DN14784_c0_g1_i4.p2 TRINITY_DN14784_c0_g1~~TRINITY_DN14784_c0_g1_i4.p2  ORF type:complete len:104 (+),score=9.92 TRINITY_DN14784_c0_g1_i4:111-422(+)
MALGFVAALAPELMVQVLAVAVLLSEVAESYAVGTTVDAPRALQDARRHSSSSSLSRALLLDNDSHTPSSRHCLGSHPCIHLDRSVNHAPESQIPRPKRPERT